MADALPRRGLAAIAIAAVVPTMDGTISVVAVPTLARVFDAGFATEQWLLNIAPLLLTLCLVPAGLASDQFGRRRLLRLGLGAVILGAAIAGTATSVWWLLAGRAVAGIGGAALLPATIALVREHSPKTPKRTRRFGLLAGWAGLAAAIGPLLGGFLVDHVSWRWVYAVPAVLAALAFANSGAIADDAARSRAGSVLRVAAGAWGRGEVSRNCLAGNAITFALYFGLFGISYLLVAGGQATLGWSATTAALSVVPMAIAMWLGSERFGILVHRVGTRWLTALAAVGAAAGLAWTGYAIDAGASWWRVLPGTVLFGVALSAAAAPLTQAAVTSLPGALAGVASAVHHAVVRTSGIGATLGLGLLAAGDRPLASPEGLANALLVSAAVVGVGGLSAVGWLDDQAPGSVPPVDTDAAAQVEASRDSSRGAVGHQASMS